ncbi:UvrD-helicase domain-containing protein [Fusobacterium animalis]|uniref:UvrD-helicase domain-containing protein n=1 Tax=Fusobacterium animalis TaxID=76859 RepID=UPI0030D045E4
MIDYKKEFEINDDEIEKIYEILFNKKGNFEEEKQKIIKSFESCCIEAVPGSGKTTTLVAKLIILAEKLNKGNYEKGICILTHTNIGIDIIKEKLGMKGDVLFRYPNFVGTLQSFIDNYLAIPCYKKKYKRKVDIIDNDVANSYNLKFLKNNSYFKQKENMDTEKLYYNFYDEYFYIEEKAILKSKDSNTYKSLFSRIENNILRYEEAIQLGKIYVNEYPNLKEYFSERFFLALVDEMQDTTQDAFEILENLFDKEKVTVQYIGDRNQNLYNGTDKWYLSSEENPKLNISNRFGKNIANFLNYIRENLQDKPIKGNSNIEDYKPILFLYDSLDKNEEEGNNKIFDEFIKVIKGKGLDKKEGSFKVIGHVGKENRNITISSYFKEFSKKEKIIHFNKILKKNSKSQPENKKIIKELKSKIELFLKKEDKEELKEKFDEFIKIEENRIDFNRIIYNYLLDKDENKFLDNLFYFLERILKESLKKEKFNEIFKIKEVENKNNNEMNTYIKDNIKLEINTVHGVKGETHLATLYLDTFWYKYDISHYLIKLLSSKLTNKQKNNIQNIKRNRNIFVGASRARYLLCFVCKGKKAEMPDIINDIFEEVIEI